MRREGALRAEPNPAHLALARLENLVPRFTLITQNVDGLHRRAGSRTVVELHGDSPGCAARARAPVADEWEEPAAAASRRRATAAARTSAGRGLVRGARCRRRRCTGRGRRSTIATCFWRSGRRTWWSRRRALPWLAAAQGAWWGWSIRRWKGSGRGSESTTWTGRRGEVLPGWWRPRGRSLSLYSPPRGQVAQLVEQRTENPRVGGSIPSLATRCCNTFRRRTLMAE